MVARAAGPGVVLGCAHSGVVNTLDAIAKISGKECVHAVLGGMHLLRASTERMARTTAALKSYGVQVVAPMHCTGQQQAAAIRAAMPEQFVQLAAGLTLTIPRG